MSFLSPWSAVVAGAVALPLLLLLYFLKLRRYTLRIPSTLLWQSSAEDLQANVPFQRLRMSMLLLLQLLLLVLLLAALARPVLESAGTARTRTILLIDCSASMRAVDAGGDPARSRLEAARNGARETVRRLGRRHEPSEIMIVAFASDAQVVSGFESNGQVLLDVIDAIEPTDEPADLDAALRLAGAFARGDESADAGAPEIVLFSDGIVAPPPPGGFELDAGRLRFVGVGPPPATVRNIGIARFSARRDYDEAERVLVFARLVNAGSQPVDTTVTLRADGEALEVRPVRIDAAGPDGPGEAAVTVDVMLPGAAILSLTCAHHDTLASDNAAALLVAAPHAPRIGLVHAGPEPDPFLVGLIEALEPRRLAVVPTRDGEVLLPWSAGDVDVVIFDRVSGPTDADLPTLTFGAAPRGIEQRESTRGGAGRVLSWQRVHPLMRHVSLDALRFVGHGAYVLPQGWDAVAVGPEGPVIVTGSTARANHVAVGFALRDSNWPVDVSVAVFLQNALEHLARAAGSGGVSFRPGEPIAVRVLPDAQELRVEGPVPASLAVTPGAEATLALPRVGVYSVTGAAPPHERLALNLASATESDLRPRTSVVVNASDTAAGVVGDAAPLELWPILAGIALGLLLLEWVVYCMRAGGVGGPRI